MVTPDEYRPRRSPLHRFALLSALWIGVAVVFAVQIYALGFLTWQSAVLLALLDWGPWILFAPLVLWLARRFPLTPQHWRRPLVAHLVFCVLVVLAMGLSTLPLVSRRELVFERRPVSDPSRAEDRDHAKPGDGPPDTVLGRLLGGVRVSVPVYWMLVAGAQAMAQYRRGVERERRALLAEAALAEARLQALQGQLNPHFLFNTLNTITELVYEDPKGAERMIVALADLLRAALAAQKRPQVPLGEEIAFVRHYCGIQRVRFSERLDVRYEIDETALGAAVPTLVLQPLVENAVIHGMADSAVPLIVWVRARREGERLRLEIADSGGAGATPPEAAGTPLVVAEGVGLGNTRARLAALHGDAHRFSITRAVEGGVSVVVELPFAATAHPAA